MSSGSKKRRTGPRARPSGTAPPDPPELSEWQRRALDAVAGSRLASEVVFGGGAALAAIYLHHRRSEDLDFFLGREIEPGELKPVARALSRDGVSIDQHRIGPRLSLTLVRDGAEFGRIDFAFYPYDPIGRRTRWRGLVVESLPDMIVNKLQAVLTRFQPRDFVDLHFMLRADSTVDVDHLLGLVRAKFDVGADRLALAQRLLMARQITVLPSMILPLELDGLVKFFDELAREIVRLG